MFWESVGQVLLVLFLFLIVLPVVGTGLVTGLIFGRWNIG